MSPDHNTGKMTQ